MAIKKVFKSYIPSLNYVTQRGRTCTFTEGRFETDVPEEVAELNELVNSKSNPHIYIDPDEQEIDTTLQDRIRKAQQEATLRVLEEVSQEKNQDSNSQQTGQQQASQTISPAAMLGVMNSATLAKGTAQQSNGAPVSVNK